MTSQLTRLGAVLALVVACGLTACTSGSAGSSGSAGASGHTGTGGTGSAATSQPVPSQRSFLGVSAQVSYDNQDAIALAKKVSSGAGYHDIISDMLYPELLQHFSGAVIGDLHLDIVFTGEVKQAVRVTNIDVTSVRASRQALSGTYLPIAHAGGQGANKFTVDMNQNFPHLVRARGGQSFPDFNIQLVSGEQSTVGIDFTASHGSFTWLLTVTYLVGDHKYTKVVRPDAHHPFTVTARARKYGAVYVDDGYSGLYLQRK